MIPCRHEHFDFKRATGTGLVQCADCSKSIPIEQAISTLDDRITDLERAVTKLIKWYKESHDAE